MPFVWRRPPRPLRPSSTMRSGVDSTGVISIQPPPPLPLTRMPVSVRWKSVRKWSVKDSWFMRSSRTAWISSRGRLMVVLTVTGFMRELSHAAY